jgi:hypothetical protein
MIGYIRDLTDRNHHCEARLYLAERILRDPELTAQYRAIKEERDARGYLSQEASEAEYQLDNEQLRPALRAKGLDHYWDAL